jgi:transcriptional regulator with XRE-family HTH domain
MFLCFMNKEPANLVKHNEALKKLGTRLKEIRISKGYKSAEAAALELKVNRVQYARYEAGKNIEYLTLFDLLEKMGVSVTEFFSTGFD